MRNHFGWFVFLVALGFTPRAHALGARWAQICAATVCGLAMCVSGGCQRPHPVRIPAVPAHGPAEPAPERGEKSFSFDAHSNSANGVFRGTITITRDGEPSVHHYTDPHVFQRDLDRLSR